MQYLCFPEIRMVEAASWSLLQYSVIAGLQTSSASRLGQQPKSARKLFGDFALKHREDQ